jgi:hypothetical protein
MKMLSLFAAAAGLGLLGAAPPPMEGMYGPPGASGGYPPCSRSVRDRCIQLYERGVASRRNLAENARLGPGREPRRYAQGGIGPMGPRYGEMRGGRVAVLARNDYPPCGDGVADRCIQAPPAAAPARRRTAVSVRYDRETVRLGERG